MTFDLEKTIQYRIDGASYDFETGRTLLESNRYPYALFFGHLALEKILKALVVKTTQEHAPHSHFLSLLASKAKINIPESIIDRLAEYTEFHLESRYPDDRRDFYKKCTAEFTRQKFQEMEDIYKWLTQKLEI